MIPKNKLDQSLATQLCDRFRGFLPVVIDIESGGFDADKDALLEIAAVYIGMDNNGLIRPIRTQAFHVKPFEGANLDPKALEFNKIDPYHPFRIAVNEEKAIQDLVQLTKQYMKDAKCQRAILVGHNPAFDLSFLKAAIARVKLTNTPFHRFSTIDTATLAGLAYGQTVLAKALKAAAIDFDNAEAHSARYDAEKTAELFCKIVNKWRYLADGRS